MVVGGCGGAPFEAVDDEAGEGTWKEGGVASGSVVKRTPADTGIKKTSLEISQTQLII